MKRLKSFAALALCLGLLLALPGCGSVTATEKQLFAMNSAVSIKAYGKSAEAGLESAASVINSLGVALDPKRDGSTAYTINNSQGQSIVVTGQVAEMLLIAQQVHALSGGDFDPTVYPLVKAWGFVDGRYTVPSEAEIESLLQKVGFSSVSISAMADTDSYLLTMPAGMELTFASVARGCAAMYAVRALRQAGVESGIVSFGGTVLTLGTKPDGSDWIVALQDPVNTGNYLALLDVGEDTAVVTSGGYLRYFVDGDGNRWTHIIDPSDGFPVENGLLSATVICENGTYADALSTALCVMGEDDAKKFYKNSSGFEIILITDDQRIVVSEGVRDSFTLSNNDYSVESLSRR